MYLPQRDKTCIWTKKDKKMIIRFYYKMTHELTAVKTDVLLLTKHFV